MYLVDEKSVKIYPFKAKNKNDEKDVWLVCGYIPNCLEISREEGYDGDILGYNPCFYAFKDGEWCYIKCSEFEPLSEYM